MTKVLAMNGLVQSNVNAIGLSCFCPLTAMISQPRRRHGSRIFLGPAVPNDSGASVIFSFKFS